MNFSSKRDGFNVVMSANNFLARLYNVLMTMDAEWKSMMNSVPHVGQTSGDPHQVLLDVLGLHANSVEFHQRYAQTLTQLYNHISLIRGPGFGSLTAVKYYRAWKDYFTKPGT
jgi:hypothetical protein